MEREILIACGLVPLLAALMAIAVSSVATRSGPAWLGTPRSLALSAVAFWCAAVAVALALRQAPGLWPDEAWQQVLWPIAITSLAMALFIGDAKENSERRWLIGAVGAAATAMTALPQGEGWADRIELHRPWAFAVTSSGFINLWMLDALARRGGQRWVLWVSLAGLGGSMMLAASAYGGLAEWLFAAMLVTALLAVAASWLPSHYLWSSLYPATLFASAATASGRFFTYESHASGTYALILFLPSVIALVDLPVRHRSATVRWAVAAVSASALLVYIAWLTLAPSPDDAW